MKRKITNAQILSLLKSGKAGYHAMGNGLYFRLSAEGTGFWVLRYTIHNKRREISLGRYPDVSLADANAKTLELKAGIQTHQADPLAEKQRAPQRNFQVVDDLAEDWLAFCAKRLKHPNIPRRVYTKDLAPYMGRLTVDQVTPRDIRAMVEAITASGRPSIANDALMYSKQLFRHGIKLGLLQHNPAEAFSVTDAGGVEQSRSRVLTLQEIQTLFAACHTHRDQVSRENTLAVALLIVLGVRKLELVAAEWSEFDWAKQLWHLPAGRSKTGVAISIPLPDGVMVWLKELHIRANGSAYVFPNRRASKRFGHISPDTLNAALQKLHREGKLGNMPHFTIHDFRRTCRSLLAAEGVPPHVAERCLNHKLKGVEGIYDRYDYLEERRAALTQICQRVAPLVV